MDSARNSGKAQVVDHGLSSAAQVLRNLDLGLNSLEANRQWCNRLDSHQGAGCHHQCSFPMDTIPSIFRNRLKNWRLTALALQLLNISLLA
jgi:hypothetical protein